MKLILFLTLPLFVLDFITKEIIVRKFDPPSEAGIDSVPVIDGFFNLVRLHNTGIAFGHFNGEIWANILFTVVAVGALVYLAVAAKKGQFLTRTSRVAAALLASGILGNLLRSPPPRLRCRFPRFYPPDLRTLAFFQCSRFLYLHRSRPSFHLGVPKTARNGQSLRSLVPARIAKNSQKGLARAPKVW